MYPQNAKKQLTWHLSKWFLANKLLTNAVFVGMSKIIYRMRQFINGFMIAGQSSLRKQWGLLAARGATSLEQWGSKKNAANWEGRDGKGWSREHIAGAGHSSNWVVRRFVEGHETWDEISPTHSVTHDTSICTHTRGTDSLSLFVCLSLFLSISLSHTHTHFITQFHFQSSQHIHSPN